MRCRGGLPWLLLLAFLALGQAQQEGGGNIQKLLRKQRNKFLRRNRRLTAGDECTERGVQCADGLACTCSGRRLFGAPGRSIGPLCTCEVLPSPNPPPSPPPLPPHPPPPPPPFTTLIWYDGINYDPTTKIWSDSSGNNRHTSSPSGTPTVDNQLNGLPVVKFVGSYLRISHNINVRTQFAVMRAANGRTTWDNYGAFINRVSGRGCNWLWENNANYFHYNQFPSKVWRNGVQLTGSFSLAPINEWQIVTVEVCNGGNTNHYIARSEHSQASVEIAEILGFDDTMSDTERGAVVNYLSTKWNITLA